MKYQKDNTYPVGKHKICSFVVVFNIPPACFKQTTFILQHGLEFVGPVPPQRVKTDPVNISVNL